ncbi:2-amino-4-hydroxy-6-hydroxymethyldihydropteridine diphosphokinase [Bifidobacterium stellenboschense]|uniref:Bifunctional folate synthesis protein n=1 Tax=Bifidobacterium stellenboschense TaxID=762211 RepID=A0A087E0J9_9BIFI|nr:2-amino-4-hydroxy-6-hydroxymethyldihydropteridine diphosphokinase [Bifidobacterium stellenboschense]KFJ01300.1 2-amino-4-hydroxy-6- hydroxymethyldihydropteridine pyrophosphokinase [Bifidobacterium stellenboschense]
MDTITLTGVRANGTHGVLDFEHERAQPFVVDVTLHLDLAAAGRSDALGDTVDYGRAAKAIVAVIEGDHVDLIEKLAQDIADRLLAIEPIRTVDVTVHKPHAPITVPFDDVAVSITRSREVAGNGVADGAGASASHRVVIALGGNQGDVAATMRDAVRRIDALDGTQVTGVSPLYRTAAWGMADGTPDFLNAVVEATTTLEARTLLDALQRIERDHGRTRETHWSSRTLDLDIIDYDGVESDAADLTLPHPRAWQRAFVLVPWAALDPHADLPGLHGGPVDELAEGLLAEADGVEPPVELVAHDWMSGGVAADGVGVGSLTGKAVSDETPDAASSCGMQAWQATGKAVSDETLDAVAGASVAVAGVSVGGGNAADDTVNGTVNGAVNDTANDTVSGVVSGVVSSDVNGAADDFADGATVPLKAVISMDSTSTDAERLFREAIVAIDGLPGNQVDGISPLYHVSNFDGPDAMSAVIQIETKLGARALIASLGDIEGTHDGAIDLNLVDMEHVTADEPDCRVPWPSAKTHASVLAPWMDMDPNATLGGDPVSFLLAMAPDAGMVGMLSDNWIIGAK